MGVEQLPNELIGMITDFLNDKDLFKSRHICKKFADFGLAILQSNAKRLYIHPTRLREAIDACHHPYFSESITEVIVLGQEAPLYDHSREDLLPALHRFDRSLAPNCHRPSFPPSSGLSRHQYREAKETAQLQNKYAWPSSPTGFAASQLSESSIFASLKNSAINVESGSEAFPHQYQLLLDALRHLKNLQTLTYSSDVSKWGLCCVKDNTMERYATLIAYGAFNPESDASIHSSQQPREWTDTEVYLGLALSLKQQITKLRIEEPLPLCESIRWRLIYDPTNLPQHCTRGKGLVNAQKQFYEEIGQRIEKCTVAISAPAHYIEMLPPLLNSMKKLKSLNLLYSPPTGSRMPPGARSNWPLYRAKVSKNYGFLAVVLSSLNGPMQRLEMRNVANDWAQMPLIELGQLLVRCKDTLTGVSLDKMDAMMYGWRELQVQPNITIEDLLDLIQEALHRYGESVYGPQE